MEYLVHPTCQIPGLAQIYEQVFGPDFIGSFVEVGAFDGMTYSNTWGLACRGWNGVYVEAHPDFALQCQKVHEYSDVTVFNFAAGASFGEADLTIYGEVSTMILSKWNRDWGMDDGTPKIRVPVKPLDSILFKPFDLLVIDVEEWEIEVLKGFTLAKWLPKMVIIELHEGQGCRPDQKGWQAPWVQQYMKGYDKVYVDNINTIYVRES